jgi:hypothetical protein
MQDMDNVILDSAITDLRRSLQPYVGRTRFNSKKVRDAVQNWANRLPMFTEPLVSVRKVNNRDYEVSITYKRPQAHMWWTILV